MSELDSHVIRCPIDTLNILGAGGLKAGSVVMAYGGPGTGKSTFFAQSAALYQKDNPDAVIHYIDCENSVDLLRLEHVFRMDMDRIKIHHTATLEGAFKIILDIADHMTKQQVGKFKDGRKDVKIVSKDALQKMSDDEIFKYCENFKMPGIDGKHLRASDYGNDRDKVIKALALTGGYRMKEFDGPIPTIVLWDSIATSRPEAELEKIAEGHMGKNAAGMNVATQVISKNLSAVLGSQGGKPLTLFMPNQVRLKGFGGYGGPQEGFAGSYALEHTCHYIIKFTKINNKESRDKNFDEDSKMKTGTDFFMKIEKTKFCPATGKVSLYINDALGGLIIPMDELAYTALELGLLKKIHGGYEIPGSDLPKMKWTSNEDQDNYISGNPTVRKLLMELVTRHYRKSYFTLDLAYKNAGLDHIGKPSDEEMSTRKTIEEHEILTDLNTNPFT